jgi:hypothetical protein
MALKCPNCGRPNSGEISKCIYCGTELPVAQPAKPAAKEKAQEAGPQKMRGAVSHERIFLVVGPRPEVPDRETVKGFTKIMGWDEYSSKLKLRSPAPFILAGYDDASRVQELVNRFAEIGVELYLIKESGLTRLEKKQVARSATADETGIKFTLDNDAQRTMNFSDLFLLARGRIRLSGELKSRVGAADLSSMEMDREKIFDLMIKLRRDRRERKAGIGDFEQAETSTEVEVLDLYSKNEYEAVRVIESEFDFEPLLGLKPRLIGFKKLLEFLREKAPQMIVDESFNKTGYTYREKPVERKQSRRLAESGKAKSREKLHSSQALFTQHSGLIYLYHLKQKLAAEEIDPAEKNN